jgi:hypothetical protein
MQRAGGAVIADLAHKFSLGREGVEAVEVGALVNEAALVEDIEEIGFVG